MIPEITAIAKHDQTAGAVSYWYLTVRPLSRHPILFESMEQNETKAMKPRKKLIK